MSTPELEFRAELNAAMRGVWLMTWHEDREINPGVPDVSYVMHGGYYETGWLELKALRNLPANGQYKFKIEQSQHSWIEQHHKKVPVHFLLKTPSRIWLFPGQHHHLLANPISLDALRSLSDAEMFPSNTRQVLYEYLRKFTDRRRYE